LEARRKERDLVFPCAANPHQSPKLKLNPEMDKVNPLFVVVFTEDALP
jgi:hypothetical protein